MTPPLDTIEQAMVLCINQESHWRPAMNIPDRPYPDPDTEPRGPSWDDLDEADTRADAAYDRYREDCGAARRKLLAAADAMDEAAEALLDLARADATRHAREMRGAAQMARQWAEEVK